MKTSSQQFGVMVLDHHPQHPAVGCALRSTNARLTAPAPSCIIRSMPPTTLALASLVLFLAATSGGLWRLQWQIHARLPAVGKVFVSYAYFEKDAVQAANLALFLSTGMGIDNHHAVPPDTFFSVVVLGDRCSVCTPLLEHTTYATAVASTPHHPALLSHTALRHTTHHSHDILLASTIHALATVPRCCGRTSTRATTLLDTTSRSSTLHTTTAYGVHN